MRLIDADALWTQMKEFYEKRAEEANMTGDRVVCVTWHDAVILIKHAPTADVRPNVRDRWLAIGNTGLASCGCGFITDRYSMYNYCPLCGAEMRGGEDGLD